MKLSAFYRIVTAAVSRSEAVCRNAVRVGGPDIRDAHLHHWITRYQRKQVLGLPAFVVRYPQCPTRLARE